MPSIDAPRQRHVTLLPRTGLERATIASLLRIMWAARLLTRAPVVLKSPLLSLSGTLKYGSLYCAAL